MAEIYQQYRKWAIEAYLAEKRKGGIMVNRFRWNALYWCEQLRRLQ